MKKYELVAKKGRRIETFTVKAESGTEAKAKIAEQTGKDADTLFVRKWTETGRGGKVLRERNYSTPLGL